MALNSVSLIPGHVVHSIYSLLCVSVTSTDPTGLLQDRSLPLNMLSWSGPVSGSHPSPPSCKASCTGKRADSYANFLVKRAAAADHVQDPAPPFLKKPRPGSQRELHLPACFRWVAGKTKDPNMLGDQASKVILHLEKSNKTILTQGDI